MSLEIIDCDWKPEGSRKFRTGRGPEVGCCGERGKTRVNIFRGKRDGEPTTGRSLPRRSREHIAVSFEKPAQKKSVEGVEIEMSGLLCSRFVQGHEG